MVECVSDGRLTVRRECVEKSRTIAGIPSDPWRAGFVSLGDASARKVYQAPSLWHLALAHPEECKRQLFPLLIGYFECCRLLRETNSVERELLDQAAVGDVLTRQRLMELIRQLGDNDFAKRQAADQELRSLGESGCPGHCGSSTPMNSMPSNC